MLSPVVIEFLSKELAPSSVKRYIQWSNYICPTEYNVNDFINFHKLIDDEFKSKKDYTSIISVIIKVLTIEGKDPSIYIELNRIARGNKDIYSQPTTKALDNKITIEDIYLLRDKYDKIVRPDMFHNYARQFLYMITDISPFRRQDYINTTFNDTSPNYVDLEKGQIIYREGKVQASKRVIDLPPKVFEIIKFNKDTYKRIWLFPTMNKSDRHMSNETFGSFIKKIFNADITLQVLRTLFVSHYADSNMPKDERIKKAELMGHTYVMSETNYTSLQKDDPLNEMFNLLKPLSTEKRIEILQYVVDKLSTTN